MNNRQTPLTFKTMLDVYERLQNKDRVQALQETRLLDTPPEHSFDNLTNLACKLLDAPVSLVSLVDTDRQFFKSSQGLAEPFASEQQTPLSHSICQYVVANEQLLAIEDARQDSVFCNNLAISEMNVIAYLGVPLTTRGQTLGSFCVIDDKPRDWSEEDREIVEELAELAVKEIELGGHLRRLEAAEESLRLKGFELRELNADLEAQVVKRTRALELANRKLTQEIENRRRLEREIMKIAEAERHRIGQDLHDDLQQQLGSIVILTDILRKQMEAQGSPHAEGIGQIRLLLTECIESTRRLANSLVPVHVQRDGLAAALAQLVESMERVSNITCRFISEGTVNIRNDEVATHLYRIAQESSTNAFKYAQAKNIIVSLVVKNNEGVLSIEDDGVGITEETLVEKRGMGLHTMNYRANLIEGSLEVKRREGKGTAVICTFPLGKESIPNKAVEEKMKQQELLGNKG